MFRTPRASRLGAPLLVAAALSQLPHTSAFAAAEVIITEIYYNPDGANDQTREFIELKNVGDETADMSGWQFTNGVLYTFANGTTLAPGEFLVLVANQASFALSYPAVTVAGQFSDDDGALEGQPALQNSGERVTLKDGPDLTGNTIFSVRYGDGRNADPITGDAEAFERALWPSSPDGDNHTLVSLDPNDNPDPDDYRNWRPSIALHGSPGADEPLPVPLQRIYINEIRTRDGVQDNDAVELYNPGTEAVDVGGWFLSDNMEGIEIGDTSPPSPPDRRMKTEIPAGTMVPAGGYVTLTNGVDGIALSVSSKGERLFLYSGNADGNLATVGDGSLTGWVHGFHVEASADGKTFARFVDSSGKEQLLVDDPSLGADNGTPFVPDVIITEIMYTPAFGSTVEYIKIKNVGVSAAPLYDVLATSDNLTVGGFGVTLPGLQPTLAAGEEAFVTAGTEAAFRAAYNVDPAARVFADPLGGGLSGGGELIELRLPVTIDSESREVPTNTASPRYYRVLDEVCYDDDPPWPTAADGRGYSLVRVDEAASGYDAPNWKISEHRGGTAYGGDIVLVNEILAHTDAPQTDVIELYNPGAAPVDIGGWFLTDDPLSAPTKFVIPPGTTVPAGGYWAINEDNDFNPDTGAPAGYFGNAFSISSRGDDDIYLFSGNGVSLTGYGHGVEFRATANGVSIIRHVNSEGRETFHPQAGGPSVEVNAGKANPIGAANGAPLVERAVISEIFYAPGAGDVEFIEIANISGTTLALYDTTPIGLGGNPNNNWQLDGVTFTFPGVMPTIPAGGRVVIIPQGVSEAAFRTQYSVPVGVTIYGDANGYVGALNNGGEEIALLRPDKPDLVMGQFVTPLIQVDSITYDDAAPWPTTAGKSIERIDENAFGDEASNWQVSFAAVGTPGSANSSQPGYDTWAATQFTPAELAGAGTGPGEDFNGNGYSNLHAYAFGFSPKGPLPGDKLPQVMVVGAGSTQTLAISFRQNTSAPDLTYVVQRSSDLTSWADIDNPSGAPVDNGDGTQTVSHTDAAVIGDGDESFLRVVVQMAAP